MAPQDELFPVSKLDKALNIRSFAEFQWFTVGLLANSSTLNFKDQYKEFLYFDLWFLLWFQINVKKYLTWGKWFNLVDVNCLKQICILVVNFKVYYTL